MRYAVAVGITALVLASCANVVMPLEPQPFTGPDGLQAYMMLCSGPKPLLAAVDMSLDRDDNVEWIDCYEMAQGLCPNGYLILRHQTFVYETRDERRELDVECRA